MPDLIDELADANYLRREELLKLVRSAPHRYKVFQIPKRKTGQYRTIAQPAREVKMLQYWIMEHLLRAFPVHPAATAYRKGQSIVHNAQVHCQSRYILKMDFKDFFPSIKAADLAIYLRRAAPDLTAPVVDALCRVLFWRPKGQVDLRLSIGAPSSPMLSNILMRRFDSDMYAFCRMRQIAYTRYADDLTFSAAVSSRLQSAEQKVAALCRVIKSPVLKINVTKTVRVSKRESRRVTGLVITNDEKLSLGRVYKRRLRAAVHHFANNRLQLLSRDELHGLIAFVQSVEPSFLARLRSKYGSDTIERLRRPTD